MDEVRLSSEKKRKNVEELLRLYQEGLLGGEIMSEDAEQRRF